MSREHVSQHHPVLGTMLELRIAGPADEAAARRVEDAVLAEFDRLEALLTVHRPDSALVRWRSGAVDDPGDEVVAVLDEAARWWRLGQGALHPATGAMTASWRRAERVGRVPDDAELDALAGAATSLPYEVVDGRLARTGDTSGVDLNALAKGWIVDRAVDVGRRLDGVSRLVVNAGGDLVHAGEGELVVAVEHPDRPHHNGAPLDRVSISNEALATSGSSHRGFRVAGRWYGHVLDPRTARPVDRVRAASVVAPTAAVADAVATVVGVLPVEESIALVATLDGVSCCVVDAAGAVHVDRSWAARRVV